MNKILTYLLIIGVGVMVYNNYKKTRQVNVTIKK